MDTLSAQITGTHDCIIIMTVAELFIFIVLFIHITGTHNCPSFKLVHNKSNTVVTKYSSNLKIFLVATTMTFDLYFDVGGCHGYQRTLILAILIIIPLSRL